MPHAHLAYIFRHFSLTGLLLFPVAPQGKRRERSRPLNSTITDSIGAVIPQQEKLLRDVIWAPHVWELDMAPQKTTKPMQRANLALPCGSVQHLQPCEIGGACHPDTLHGEPLNGGIFGIIDPTPDFDITITALASSARERAYPVKLAYAPPAVLPRPTGANSDHMAFSHGRGFGKITAPACEPWHNR